MALLSCYKLPELYLLYHEIIRNLINVIGRCFGAHNWKGLQFQTVLQLWQDVSILWVDCMSPLGLCLWEMAAEPIIKAAMWPSTCE